jgi:Uma2 family endonuclease
MIISSTKIQNKFGKYLKLLNQEDIIITKNGKKVAWLVKFYEKGDDIIKEGSSAYIYEGMEVSYKEFLKITRESENRYEYIDGKIYLLSSPKVKHQKIVMVMSNKLSSYFQNKECFPLTSPLNITLYRDNQANIVQPDLLVICDQENIKEDDTYMGTPSLVMEVVSESSRSKDIIQKLELYMRGGIEEYWIVNPFCEEITIYRFKESEVDKSITYRRKEVAKSFEFQGLEISVDEVFEGKI